MNEAIEEIDFSDSIFPLELYYTDEDYNETDPLHDLKLISIFSKQNDLYIIKCTSLKKKYIYSNFDTNISFDQYAIDNIIFQNIAFFWNRNFFNKFKIGYVDINDLRIFKYFKFITKEQRIENLLSCFRDLVSSDAHKDRMLQRDAKNDFVLYPKINNQRVNLMSSYLNNNNNKLYNAYFNYIYVKIDQKIIYSNINHEIYDNINLDWNLYYFKYTKFKVYPGLYVASSFNKMFDINKVSIQNNLLIYFNMFFKNLTGKEVKSLTTINDLLIIFSLEIPKKNKNDILNFEFKRAEKISEIKTRLPEFENNIDLLPIEEQAYIILKNRKKLEFNIDILNNLNKFDIDIYKKSGEYDIVLKNMFSNYSSILEYMDFYF